MRHVTAFLLAASLTACASGEPRMSLPSGAEAYSVIPAAPATANASVADYRIGALDTVDITVFDEPDLSAKALQVDAAGQIALPLIGTIEAKGRTASELSKDIEQRLGGKYVRDPQVTVSVAASVSQKVSIEGEVTEPGVYPLTGPTTLLGAIAMAKGETEVSKLREVVVFRTIKGQRMGAVFDVSSIRRGAAADPMLEGNDMVVVGYSAAKRFWKNVVSAAPMLSIFRPVTF